MEQMPEEKVGSRFVVFKMHEITVHFWAAGKIPVERETLMMQERGDSCGVLSFSR